MSWMYGNKFRPMTMPNSDKIAIDGAIAAGIVMVAAAANDSRETSVTNSNSVSGTYYPCSYDPIICVASNTA